MKKIFSTLIPVTIILFTICILSSNSYAGNNFDDNSGSDNSGLVNLNIGLGYDMVFFKLSDMLVIDNSEYDNENTDYGFGLHGAIIFGIPGSTSFRGLPILGFGVIGNAALTYGQVNGQVNTVGRASVAAVVKVLWFFNAFYGIGYAGFINNINTLSGDQEISDKYYTVGGKLDIPLATRANLYITVSYLYNDPKSDFSWQGWQFSVGADIRIF